MLGKIHVYTGKGKGKTTCAMGLAVRAIGQGTKTKIIQFFKTNTGEKKVLSKICDYVQFEHKHPFFLKNNNSDFEKLKLNAQLFWKKEILDVNLDEYGLVILDEIGPAVAANLISEKDLCEFINNRPKKTELILTGRNIPKSIIEYSDYCTNMQEIKHPFNDLKLPARKGIEF